MVPVSSLSLAEGRVVRLRVTGRGPSLYTEGALANRKVLPCFFVSHSVCLSVCVCVCVCVSHLTETYF
jgi:hypothetical protein